MTASTACRRFQVSRALADGDDVRGGYALLTSQALPAAASVNWSPASLPPTVTIVGATPSL